MIADAIAGQLPLNFLIPFIGLVGVPTSCAVAGAVPKVRRSISLFQLFYGVEAPLLTVCLMRFFWLRDLTPANALMLVTGLIGTVMFAHWLLHNGSAEGVNQDAESVLPVRANSMRAGGYLAAQSIMLVIALYLVAIASFYVLPTLKFLLLYFLPLAVYATILFPLTVLLAGMMSLPFGMAIAYGKAWQQTFRQLASRYGKGRLSAVTVAIVTVWISVFIVVQQQPHVKAFALLENLPQTDTERQEVLQKSELIRKGLLNAYLADYRYPYVQDTSIQNMYQYEFSLSEEEAAGIQAAYSVLTAPFRFQGTPADRDKAATLYAQFFDTPILRAEQAAIKKAVQSTFNRNEAKAGLLDIGEQRVWLSQQQVTVTPEEDWAEVELHEVYANKTLDQEEILYYFSLPESAAITGLWLGETADRSQAFTHVIAPRGAAQQVYTQEVNRRVDPALLEQVGPHQYRLRVFPVPPMGQGQMHLWLTYKVLKQEGGWAMPHLNEQRNIFWTSATQRMINGKRAKTSDRWLPEVLPAEVAPPTAHQISLPWNAHILATPFASTDYLLPQGKRFAVILDGSRSMDMHRPAMHQTFRWLQDHILTQNTADLYLTKVVPAQPQRLDGLKDFDTSKAVFYGTLEPKVMLQQFQQLRGNTDYDAILLITDPGSYELASDNQVALSMPAPLWLVHLDGLQPAYDDVTLQAIQDSGGGVSTNVQEVMQRLSTKPSKGAGTSLLNVVDGYAWYLVQDPDPSATKTEGFAHLAARQWVTHLSRYITPTQLKELDTIHAVTKEYGIVTPYSSMIVLVNDAQRESLRQAEQSDDRFDREVEDQQLPQPNNVAVPEPAEWMLIGVGAIVLWCLYRQKQRYSLPEPDR